MPPAAGLRYSPAGRAAAAVGKSALRAGCELGVPLRGRFDFLVIGAKRGGTTSLWRYLEQHPGVLPLVPRAANVKGTYFLADEWSRGERWWRSHVPTAVTRRLAEARLGHRALVGEACPYYLFHPLAPARAAAVAPAEARFVAVLRDPVERAWSHYKERRANGTEPLTFADALDAEPVRLRGEEERIVTHPGYRSFAHRHQSYVAQGRYAPMLRRWYDAVGPDRVLVLVSEAMYADPQQAIDQVTAHLGLPARRLRDDTAHNQEPSAHLDRGIRGRLRAELAPAIEEVEELLGRKLPWPAQAEA